MGTLITDRIGTLLRLGFLLLGFHSVLANAAPPVFMYQGRIIDSAGKPLEYGSVSFEFTILSPDGSCVLYKEQINNVDMRNSKGVFETAIGTGVKSYPATPSFSLLDAFSNAASLTCSGGTPYTPLESSGRVLRVQFFDGKGWQLVTPDSVIRSVPYAGFASSAERLGAHPIGDFVLKPTSCTAGQVIGFDGTGFTCTTNGATNGTLTSISSANSYLTVTNPTSTPVLTVNVGTAAGTVAAGNDARFTDARTPIGTAGGDLVGSYPNPTVAQLQGRPFSNAAPADGQAVLWDAGNNTWKPQYIRMQDIRNQWGGSTMMPSTACASNEAMVWSVLTDRFTCQAISLNGSAITAGTIAPARLGSGTADNTKYLAGDGTWQTLPTADTSKLPLAGGTMSGNIDMNGNKIINVSNVPFVAANPAVGQNGQSLRWNNGTGQWEWFTAGVAGSGIQSVNGQTGNAQSLAPTASATSYGFTTASNTHTFSIPSASTAGVTAGTISKTEYDTFNSKAAAGNYIVTLTGDVTSSGYSAGSVTTSIANNAVTTAKIADGNVTGVKLENSGVTAGTYTSVTVDAKGRVTAGASLAAADIPNLDASKITSGVLAQARLGTGTADNTKYLRGDGTWQTFSFTESDPKVGSNTSNYLSKWNGSALVTSGVFESGGDVGIGTNTPGAKLEVAGQVKITGGTPGAGKVLTSDAAGLATWETPAAGNPGTVTTVSSTNSYLIVANGSSTPALTLNVGTAANTVAAGNDSRFTDSRAPSGAAGGDLSGSYPNPTVAKVQGTAVSATAPTAAGQVLRYNGTTSWVAGFLSLADIRSSVTPANTMFPTTSCTAAETLTWSSLTDTMGCTTIGIVATQVTSGTLAAARMPAFTGDVTSTVNTTALTIANNAVTSAKILDGTITSADLASTLTDTLWTASSGHVYRSSGNVGIGTTAPNSLLHLLASGTNAGTHLEMQNTDAGGRDWRISTGGSSGAVPAGKFAITDVTASTVRMTIDSSGNMGIGTTNPSTRLHVASASGSSIVRNEAGSGGIAYFLGYRPGAVAGDSLARFEARPTEMTDGNGASISFRSTETPGATAAAGTAIDFFSRANGGTNSSNRMTIDHNGNVGIGTTSPGYSLDLQSTTGSIAATRTMASAVGPDIYLQKDRGSVGSPAAVQNGDALGHLNFRGYDGTNYIRGARISSLVSAAPATNQLSAFLAFFTNNAGADATERMRITSTGNVGIGTTAPAYEVDVVGDARVSGEFISTNSNQARFISGNYGVIHRNDGTNYYLLLTASGDQYGSWNTLRPLTITTSTGNIQMGNNVLNVQHGGNVGIGTTSPAEKLEVSGNVKATNFISTSDRRLKKDIQPIEGLSAILKLNGVKYRWIKDNAPDGGVIAQEVEAVFPEAVRTDANTGMKGVKYQFLFGPLIESTKELYGMCKDTQEKVQAQDRRIASVEEENAQLKKTTEELKKENDDLKKRLEAIEKHLGLSK